MKAAGLQNACAKPVSARAPATSAKDVACACQSIAPDHSAPEPPRSTRASRRSVATPAASDVTAKSVAKPSDASSPYAASSKPSATFMNCCAASAPLAPKSTR